MSTTPAPQRSGLEKFLDNFLHESSIKWMLLSGAAIIAASSLMLVTHQWSSWPVTLKYLTILSYTAVTFGIAEYCGNRLKLPATAQVLRLLTLLLIPIGFLSLSWLTYDASDGSLANSFLTLSLMVPATAFMYFACDRIFRHWLQGRQTTFLVSYMLLCLAGAMPTIEQTWLAVLFSSGFWLVMTLGVLKVNRHIFWLTEEHRWPRIFGFIPVALLSAMLVVLVATKTIGAVPLQWLGFGLVMVAATILMTTRTIASVFKQRTGDLIRPLPWSIVAPLFIGILLVAGGVICSFYGFHFVGPTTYAVVPTALVAACLLLITAKDTRHQGFVWAGLILITVAYQSTPSLFSEIVQAIKATAAATIQEERLPFAFYGITYMPLLLIIAAVSRWTNTKKLHEFSLPMQRFVVGLSVLLVALSLTNLKAAFIVNALTVTAFLVLGALTRDRKFIVLSLSSVFIASVSVIAAGRASGFFDCDIAWTLAVIAVVGLVFGATKWFDQMSRLITASESSHPLYQPFGWGMTALAAVGWVALQLGNFSIRQSIEFHGLDVIVVGSVLSALAIITWQTRHYVAGVSLWAMAAVAAFFGFVALSVGWDVSLASATLGTGILSIASFALLRYRGIVRVEDNADVSHQVSRFRCDGSRLSAFVMPLADLTLAHFAILTLAYYVPSMALATVTLDIAHVAFGSFYVFGLVVVAAILFRGVLVTSAILLLTPIVAGLAVGHLQPTMFTYHNLPLVYAIASAALVALVQHRITTAKKTSLVLCSIWLYGLVSWGLVFLSPASVASSAISLAVLYVLNRKQDSPVWFTRLVGVAGLQTILGLGMCSGFTGFTALLPSSGLLLPACAWMIGGVAAAILLLEQLGSSAKLDSGLRNKYVAMLRVAGLIMFLITFAPHSFGIIETVIVALSVIVISFNQWRVAVRRQSESHVWNGILLLGLLGVWHIVHHDVAIAHGLVRVVMILAAPVLLWLSSLWKNHPRYNVLVRGAESLGIVTPFVVAAWSLLASPMQALETFTLFASALVLFGYGRTQGEKRYVIAAATIVNLGFWSLWSSLQLSDPQYYLVPIGLTVIGLVELLRQEIPTRFHDPLRYAGALAILVSPCFEIVGGSWIHLMSLMVLSVLVIMLAIGLRVKALIHTGVAFLLMDLLAMVIRTSIDNTGMLWGVGLLFGAAVIAIAAFCENHRETLLSRIRLLSAELATWR